MTKQPTSLNCFLCGKKNPHGLKMEWLNNYESGHIEGAVMISDDYCSYKGIVHGGIVAAILDETAGRAIMLDNDFDRFMVTMKMETTYRKPTPTNTLLRAVGRVVQDRGSSAKVEGFLYTPDGAMTASCAALIMRADHITAVIKSADEMAEWNRTRPQNNVD